MTLTYEIDHVRRIVFTQGIGVLTKQDLFAYQIEVWSAPEIRNYDECVDLTSATSIEGATDTNMRALAELSVRKDDPQLPSRFAIIARDDLQFGLARMYETYRTLQQNNSRHVAVFRTRDEALRWLAGDRTAS